VKHQAAMGLDHEDDGLYNEVHHEATIGRCHAHQMESLRLFTPTRPITAPQKEYSTSSDQSQPLTDFIIEAKVESKVSQK